MENQFRRALIVSDGDFGAFFERPLSLERSRWRR